MPRAQEAKKARAHKITNDKIHLLMVGKVLGLITKVNDYKAIKSIENSNIMPN